LGGADDFAAATASNSGDASAACCLPPPRRDDDPPDPVDSVELGPPAVDDLDVDVDALDVDDLDDFDARRFGFASCCASRTD
jgi:hypothetical protein